MGAAVGIHDDLRHPNGFEAKLCTTSGRYPADRATCEAIVGMLKKIRIDMKCEALSFPLYRKVFSAYQSGKEKGAAMFYQGYGNAAGDPVTAVPATSSCTGAWSHHCFKDLDEALERAAATVDPEAQHLALQKMTDMMQEKVTHKIFFQIHDVSAHHRRVEFRPRYDEMLFP